MDNIRDKEAPRRLGGGIALSVYKPRIDEYSLSLHNMARTCNSCGKLSAFRDGFVVEYTLAALYFCRACVLEEHSELYVQYVASIL